MIDVVTGTGYEPNRIPHPQSFDYVRSNLSMRTSSLKLRAHLLPRLDMYVYYVCRLMIGAVHKTTTAARKHGAIGWSV
jgi:hypothetical protein